MSTARGRVGQRGRGPAVRLAGTAAALGALGASLLGASTSWAPIAHAHSFLVSSDPADGASVAVGPERVSLTFNEPLQDIFDAVTVVGPDANLWSVGITRVRGSTVGVDVRPLGPTGDYTVAYRVISADSHPVTGSVSFTLTTTGTGTPGPAASGATGSGAAGGDALVAGPDDGPPWWWIAGGAMAVFGVGVVVAVRRPPGALDAVAPRPTDVAAP